LIFNTVGFLNLDFFLREGHLKRALLNAHSRFHFSQTEFSKACHSAATQNRSAVRFNLISILLCDIIIEFSLEHCMLY